jgi:serine/threonine-protein kinase RIM15
MGDSPTSVPGGPVSTSTAETIDVTSGLLPGSPSLHAHMDVTMLAPPAVTALRASMMERSLSEDIREEREELRKAAEETLNVIMDLDLDGTIRWVSPSWVDVIGTDTDAVAGTPISDLIVSENKSIFTDVVESMKKDDSRSQFIRFVLQVGSLSKMVLPDIVEGESGEQALPSAVIELEAQGIMVYDVASGGESHVSFATHKFCYPYMSCLCLPCLL